MDDLTMAEELGPNARQTLAAFAVAERGHNAMAALVNTAKRASMETVEVRTLDLNAVLHVMHCMNDALVKIIGQGWIYEYAENVDKQDPAKPVGGYVQ